MIGEEWNGKDMNPTSCGLIWKTVLSFAWRFWGESEKHHSWWSLGQIWATHFPNTRQMYYHMNQLVHWSQCWKSVGISDSRFPQPAWSGQQTSVCCLLHAGCLKLKVTSSSEMFVGFEWTTQKTYWNFIIFVFVAFLYVGNVGGGGILEFELNETLDLQFSR